MHDHDPRDKRLIDLMLEKDRIESEMKEIIDRRRYGFSKDGEADLAKLWNELQTEMMRLDKDIELMIRRVRLNAAGQ